MAAPQWTGGKCKSVGHAKAFFRHNDKVRREESKHTNPHIDKTKTHLNFSVRGLDYAGLCAAYDARAGAVDLGRPSSGKNARVVMQSVVVYLPEGLADKDADTKARWFRRAGDILESRFGENFLDMQVDFDEVHEYIEPKTGEKRLAREHGHARLFPEVDGKLNAKAFSSRAAINGLNNELQEMSLLEFGVPMMDGSKAKGGQSVEQLKAQSRAAEIIKTAEEAAQSRSEAILSEAREEAAQIRETAQKASEGLLEAARKEADKTKRDALTNAEATKRVAREYARTLREKAKKAKPIERQLLEIAKGMTVTVRDRNGRPQKIIMYDHLARTAKAAGIDVPEAAAEQSRQTGRDISDLSDV